MVDYIDLEFFQNYTRTIFDATTNPTDTQVQLYIDLANQEVEDLTGRVWNKVEGYAQYIESPSELELLKHTPVLAINSVVDSNGDAVSYTLVDRDLIKLDKLVEVTIDYDYGYELVPVAVKMLATLYTLQKSVQGASASADNTESIKVGPISISSGVGLSTVVNLQKDINKYESKIRRLVV